jgi:hypothetical protein
VLPQGACRQVPALLLDRDQSAAQVLALAQRARISLQVPPPTSHNPPLTVLFPGYFEEASSHSCSELKYPKPDPEFRPVGAPTVPARCPVLQCRQ